jgi:uncharacterized protein (UPF0548 family)
MKRPAVSRDLFANPSRAAGVLADLNKRRLNFDPGAIDPYETGSGWRIDNYCQQLPREGPGAPSERGAWATARRLLRDYEFIDPSIVRAMYRTGGPLKGRDMLLELRLYSLRFHVGVRIVEVSERLLSEDGREATTWGWSYSTLEGNFEVGQMDYEVRKWHDTGEVEFRIHAFSRVAPIPNPVIRLGFRLFGRRKQTQFARRACERMLRLTREELEGRAQRSLTAERSDELVVRPAVAR